MKYSWWQYREAGTYSKDVIINDANSKKASFIIPPDALKGQTIHIILEVNDNGTPNLTRYQRIIIKVR